MDVLYHKKSTYKWTLTVHPRADCIFKIEWGLSFFFKKSTLTFHSLERYLHKTAIPQGTLKATQELKISVFPKELRGTGSRQGQNK